MRRFLVLSLALIAYGSLYPWHFAFSGGIRPFWLLLHNWPNRLDLWTIRDTILNILLYLPVGLATMTLLLRSRSRVFAFTATVLIGASFSASMEFLQAYLPGRTCSLADLLTNTLGTACGAYLAVEFRESIQRLRGFGRKRPNSAALLLLCLYACYRLYPFLPILSRTHLFRGLTGLVHPASISWVEIWMQAAEWIAFSAILESILQRLRLVWFLVALCALPIQLQLLDRMPKFEDFAGAALAILLFARIAKNRRMPIAALILGSAILLRELSPFHLLSRPQPFYWMPFTGAFESGRDTSVVIIAGKAFDYGALIWLCRKLKMPPLPSAALFAAALLLLEWFQRLLPGRTPESTDAVLALLMSFALWALDRDPIPRS